LSLSSLEGLIDRDVWPDELEYTSPRTLRGLLRSAPEPSLTWLRGPEYTDDVVGIAEEAGIPGTVHNQMSTTVLPFSFVAATLVY